METGAGNRARGGFTERRAHEVLAPTHAGMCLSFPANFLGQVWDNFIANQHRGVTADTAMRLARYFGGDARSWLNLQTAFDLRTAEIENARKIQREIKPATECRAG